MRKGSLPRSETSLVLAGNKGNSGISAVVRQMRHVFGPCGGAPRQDVLAATDVDVKSNGGDDFAASAAYRNAKKKGEKEKAYLAVRKMGKIWRQGTDRY